MFQPDEARAHGSHLPVEASSVSELDNDPKIVTAVRRALLRLAKAEDLLANTEAANVPYWSRCPESVVGHRAAARALRLDAEQLQSFASLTDSPLTQSKRWVS